MMTQLEAMDYIAIALRKVIKKDKIEFSLNTDLVLEKILDSLDRLVFLLELSEIFFWSTVSTRLIFSKLLTE